MQRLKAAPSEAALLRDAGILYWNLIEENVLRCIREKSDLGEFFRLEYDFVNFGASSESLDNAAETGQRIRSGCGVQRPIKTYMVSDWLSEVYVKCMAGDRKEALRKEVTLAAMQVWRLERDVVSLQQQRRDSIIKECGGAMAPDVLSRQIEKMETADALFRQNRKIIKNSSKGVFIPATEKRKHFEREKEYTDCCDYVDRFLSSIQTPETLASVKQCAARIRENLIGVIDGEDAIGRLEKEAAEVAKKQQTISAAELSAAMSKEIEYLRELVTLSAKRLRIESCAMFKPGDAYFTVKEAGDCIDRILEFDPRLFNNPRVSLFGIPSILLVPGVGNALYDWKNNRIVLPITAPSGNFMASVAYGMIEYRLDVDESRQLLASYNKLPRHADQKSIFHLKNELTKDYITWMTSEYRGYKNLAGEVRKWFEHEIAPNKNEIAVPLELRPFYLTTETFKKKLEEIESLLAKGVGDCPMDALWTGSILYYQHGKIERAMELLKALLAKNKDHVAALYNVGHACMKLMRKQEAVDFFSEYCKRNPQSWWATVAMEHIRRLQTGYAA